MVGAPSSTFDQGLLRLRGETGVLYVVDGVKVYSQSDINTDNIGNISVLKGAAATGAAAAIGPWYIPNAFAAPVVNVLMWGEYLPDSVVADFKAKTGITVNHTKIGDNGEIISKMNKILNGG